MIATLALSCAAALGAIAGHAIGRALADIDQRRRELIFTEVDRGEFR